MLAETPQPSGGLVLVILVVLLGLLVVHLAVVGLGCLWAWRAGRGSQPALVGFLVVGALEGVYVMLATLDLLRGEPNPYLGSAVVPLVAQVGLYLGARDRRSRGR